MKPFAMVLLALSFAAHLRCDEPHPKADDPLAERMQGFWKSTFTSSVGGKTQSYVLYRVHLQGRWQQTIMDASGKVVTKEEGTYEPPPERGTFLGAQPVKFTINGRQPHTEKIHIFKIDQLEFRNDSGSATQVYQRIPSDAVPDLARMK